MRSRYTAFVLGDVAYLRLTWDPATRPRRIELDGTDRWLSLEVLGSAAGGPDDDTGTVEFRAHLEHHGQPSVIHENSRFRRSDERWFYVGSG